jgi:cardiolipin synthase
MLLADLWPAAEFIILPLSWAFAYWGVALYWVAGFIYVKQVKDLVSSSS